MGFDNDCILNIQSLAGEYFCPVCRLLVYPNEALQTQCTHLYCKPCLTYVVGTTRACPYDGYLVTEADSKPLTESNQALAEMIGKISVHCLFHRSGCTWQGSLSDCITHCSECAFGNSLVACNRCSIQILHRQVQEHAQTCTGVQSQVQQANAVLENAATATEVASNPTQATTQAGTATSQSQPSQTIAMTVKDSCEQANANSQAQAVVQTSLSTHAQWYQQQQYQQYYQQYPGYDPYQQSYPYHQQAFGQHLQHFQAHIAQVGQQQPSQPYLQAKTQPQGLAGQQLQPKAEPQPQPQPSQGPAQQQLHPQAQPQSQGPSQQQLQSQAQPQSQSQLPFPVQTHMTSQTQVQANQQQQPQPAAQAQSQLLPQAHPISLTQKQPYPQGQPHSALPPVQHPQMPHYQQPYPQMQVSQPAVHYLSQQHHLRPQSQPHLPAPPQPYPSLQPQTQHPSSHAVTNNQPYQQVLPQNQIQQQLQLTATYQQPLQVHVQGPHQLQFPQPPQTHPSVQSQTPIYQQHQAPVPSHGQASIALPAQMQQIQPNLQQVGPTIQHRPNMHPVVQPTPLVQNQSFGGQLSGQQQQLQQSMQGPSHTFQQTHGYAHSQLTASSHSVQHHQSHNVGARPVNPTHKQSQPHVQSASVLQARQVQIGTNGTSASDKTEPNVSDAGSGIEPDKSKFVKSKTDLQSLGDDSKPIGLVEDKSAYISTSTKDITESESHLEKNGIPLNKQMLKEETVGSSFDQSDGHKFDEVFADSQKKIAEKKGDETNKFQKGANAMVEGNQSQMPEHPHIQAKGAAQSAHQVMDADRRTHQLSTHHEAWTLHQQSAASSGFQSPSGHHGLQGHGHFPHHRHQPYGPETPSGPDAFIIGKGPSRSGHPSALQGPCEANPPLGQLHRPSNNDHRRPYLQHSASAGQWPFGQPSDIHGSMSGGIWPPASETVHDHMNPLHMDPGQRRFGDDINRSLRPSHLYTDHVSKIGRHFPSSRSLGGVPHGVGDIAPKPLNSERLGHISDRRHSPGAALHPYCLGSSEGGVYPTGLINDTTGRLNLSHAHPDFQGPIPGHGRRHMDGRLSRISPREHLGISRGFEGLPGGPGRNFGLEDMEIRAVRQFHEPLGNSVYAERFPLLPSGERQSEFDGLGDLRMDEQFRDHARFGDFPGNPRFRSFPDHLPPPGELFGGNRPNHPKPGEPGFRSSFILQGDMDPFDDLRKRKPGISMGWCRICKVDCETVEGLDIHSQTREHQNMAMDMVRSIKQNAKKRKLISSNHSVDASMSGNVKSEGRKSKN